MSVEAFFLSAEDKAILREVIDGHRNKKVNTTSQGKGDLRTKASYPIGAYIALPVDAEGIPALEEAGDEPSVEDVPGKAFCDVYKIDTTTGELRNVAKRVVVHNIDSSDRDKEWTLVIRTAFGEWVAAPQGGSGDIVMFQILTMEPLCCEYADSIVLAGPCSGAPNIGDSINVYDEAGCFFNEPSALLENRIGFATRLKFSDGDTGTGTGTGLVPCETEETGTGTPTYCDAKPQCRWVVFSLCCGV